MSRVGVLPVAELKLGRSEFHTLNSVRAGGSLRPVVGGVLGGVDRRRSAPQAGRQQDANCGRLIALWTDLQIY